MMYQEEEPLFTSLYGWHSVNPMSWIYIAHVLLCCFIIIIQLSLMPKHRKRSYDTQEEVTIDSSTFRELETELNAGRWIRRLRPTPTAPKTYRYVDKPTPVELRQASRARMVKAWIDGVSVSSLPKCPSEDEEEEMNERAASSSSESETDIADSDTEDQERLLKPERFTKINEFRLTEYN
jgi:hypothetical protein